MAVARVLVSTVKLYPEGGSRNNSFERVVSARQDLDFEIMPGRNCLKDELMTGLKMSRHGGAKAIL